MRIRRISSFAGLLVATSGCTGLLGDFTVGDGDATPPLTDGSGGPDSAEVGADHDADATTADGAAPDATMRSDADAAPDTDDATSPAGDSGLDAAIHDAGHDGAAGLDAGCGVGLSSCASGCVNLQMATDNCGVCGHSCNGGTCAAATCGGYVIAKQPTTGNVAKLATDGRRVVWSDTGIVAIEQIGSTGGAAIVLAPVSVTYGGIGPDLALANGIVAFTYTGTPSVGLAKVDVADSGTFVFGGAVAVSAVSLNGSATHLFFANTTGTQSSLNDCPITAGALGPCAGVGSNGRFLDQTAADDNYLLYDLTGANIGQAGLYIDTIAQDAVSIFSPATAASLAVDGTWAYWTIPNDGGATYAIDRTLESTPGQIAATPASSIVTSAFATDGANLYYWNGTAIAFRPVGGGPETALAAAASFVQIAVGGGLLVWTDGAQISGLVLPSP